MYDLIIIGAGPAGLTAALYAGRFRMNTLLLERMSPGGQIILSSLIENYPGFPGGIATLELTDRFKKQVDELGVGIESAEALEVNAGNELGSALYAVRTQDKLFKTRALIITCGARPKQLGIEGEDKFIGRGVSYCATCDGPLFKNKDVLVIGGGDKAIEEAIFLTAYAKRVSIVHRRQEFRASKILVEKAVANPKINFILESVVEKILGEAKLEGALIKNLKTGSPSEFHFSGVFIFVGIKPDTGFIKNLLETDAQGFIITDDLMQASSPGVFAAGDCRKKSLYQVITACADGAIAADSAYKYLLNR